jgi:penicillin-binding protein 2
VRISCDIGDELAMQNREQQADMPGYRLRCSPYASNPTGELTAELIGFLANSCQSAGLNLEDYYREKGFVPNRDKVGYAGIELSLQDLLGGRNGERYVEVDVAGRELRNLTEPVKPVPGNNIRLTIDVRLQSAAREALKYEINYWNTYLNRISLPAVWLWR